VLIASKTKAKITLNDLTFMYM